MTHATAVTDARPETATGLMIRTRRVTPLSCDAYQCAVAEGEPILVDSYTASEPSEKVPEGSQPPCRRLNDGTLYCEQKLTPEEEARRDAILAQLRAEQEAREEMEKAAREALCDAAGGVMNTTKTTCYVSHGEDMDFGP
jgi:hypothetical protein